MQIDKPAILPQPEPFALEYSQQLQDLIAQEIVRAGPISFARFMELALYAPGLGYYSAGSKKFGKEGDFVTAPEISSLFSLSLAKQCAQILQRTGGDILEFGAGSGRMAATILIELERLKLLPDHYFILEVSADLRQRQEFLISSIAPHLAHRVCWLNQLPTSFIGVCLANEVLDAFPVHRFKQSGEGFQEIYVDFKENQFATLLQKPSVSLKSYLARLPDLPFGYESECNLYVDGWLNGLNSMLDQGVILIVDYGFPRHEYYHPERSQGTFMCHYRHHAHSDPFTFIGLQDMTAHVDFTSVIESADKLGFNLTGYTNQASFLLSCGMIDYLQQEASPEEYLQLAAQAKVLTAPTEMGELFKSMALSKNVDIDLIGFSLRDYSERL